MDKEKNEGKKMEPDLSIFVSSLSMQTLIFLGEIDNPLTHKKEENLANITSGKIRTYEEILSQLISGKIVKFNEREKTFILEFDIYEDFERLPLNKFILINFSEFPYKLYERCVKHIKYNNVIEIARSLLLFNEKGSDNVQV